MLAQDPSKAKPAEVRVQVQQTDKDYSNNVDVTSPSDGANSVTIPKADCTADITPAQGVHITMVGMHIDGGPLRVIWPKMPSDPWASPVTFTISDGDCPSPGTWYTVAVYAFDDNGDVGLDVSNFRRTP
jgi:hypothetical protein